MTSYCCVDANLDEGDFSLNINRGEVPLLLTPCRHEPIHSYSFVTNPGCELKQTCVVVKSTVRERGLGDRSASIAASTCSVLPENESYHLTMNTSKLERNLSEREGSFQPRNTRGQMKILN